MKLRPTTLAIVLFLLPMLGAAVSSAEDELRAVRLAHQLGLSEAAIERVRQGEVVAEALEPSSEKDLSLAVVMRLDAPLGTASKFIDADRLREFQTVILSSGEIDPVNPTLAAFSLPAETQEEFVADPAGTFAMSTEEAAEVIAAARVDAGSALDTYRSLLALRAKAYWEKGLAGITPYAGKNRSPAADLAHANAAIAALIESPVMRAELEVVPSKSMGSAIHKLSWAVEKGRDKPSPVLIHRILYRQPDAEVLVERRFYSGSEYDALQIVVGILPTRSDWSAVFYTNHTYTAQVAGFGGGAKRSIGRKLLEKELVAEMQRAQKAIPSR